MLSIRCPVYPVCLSVCLSVCMSVTFVYCGQTVGRIKMKLGMQVGLAPATLSIGQTAGWMKMPLGMEVCLGPGNFVLDGDPAHPPQKGAQPPQFLAHVHCCGLMAFCIRIPLGTKVCLTRRHCVRWGSSSPSPKGAQPPIFGQCPLWPNGWMD